MKTTFKSPFLPLLRSLQIFRQWSKCNSMQCQTRNTTSWWLYSFYPVCFCVFLCVHNIIFAPYISTFSWFPPPNSAIFSLFRASSAWQCCWLPSPHHSHSLHSLYASVLGWDGLGSESAKQILCWMQSEALLFQGKSWQGQDWLLARFKQYSNSGGYTGKGGLKMT